MPNFNSALSFLSCERKLTPSELARALRFCIAAEFEAIQQYEQIADSTDNKIAKKILLDIANEERVHVGEFERLLFEIAPQEKGFWKEGHQEAEKLMK